MELYVGGCGQDKLSVVLASRKGHVKYEVFHGENMPDGQVFRCQVIDHFHLIIRKLPESDILLFLQELYEKNPEVIIICDEVGNGVVPVDREERRYREQVGRSCQWLAERSWRVVRIVCGCMQVLKEDRTGGEEEKLRICLIRHGETAGNLKKRYVGRTDEPLCPAGAENLKRLKERGRFPEETAAAEVYVSPLRRCMESAEILFPRTADTRQVIPDFRECDFGAFENLNYRELMQDAKLAPLYQAWIDSGGTLPFPGGEAVEEFKGRCVAAFAKIMELETEKRNGKRVDHGIPETGKWNVKHTGHDTPEMDAHRDGRTEDEKIIVFLVHGGTVMSILEAYGEPKKGYYDYQVPCADGYLCDYLPGRGVITNITRI